MIEVSAPGKLVVSGEYAVLTGAPALVAAVDRRVTCTLAPRHSGGWRFVSTGFTENGKKGVLKGNLTLHGVTKPVTFDVDFIGAGKDPWGGYRRGYKAHAILKRSDYGIVKSLGPAAETLELTIFIEGIRKR